MVAVGAGTAATVVVVEDDDPPEQAASSRATPTTRPVTARISIRRLVDCTEHPLVDLGPKRPSVPCRSRPRRPPPGGPTGGPVGSSQVSGVPGPVDYRWTVVPPSFDDFFTASASVAGALIGLLFVAISVSPRWSGDGATEHQVKAGAAFSALIGALVVSLAALIPGTGLATACIIVSGSGIVSAVGLGAFLARRHTERIRVGQIVLLVALAGLFVLVLLDGLRLRHDPGDTSAVSGLATVVIVLFVLAIVRAWELVGAPDTGLVSSFTGRSRRGGAPGVSPGVRAETPGAAPGRPRPTPRPPAGRDRRTTVGGPVALRWPPVPRRPTSTSAFGVSRREGHDASAFYDRFAPPTLSDDAELGTATAIDTLVTGDSRSMDRVADASVALVVTSPPYFAGKAYEEDLGRGGVPATYLEYLQMLRDVFAECVRTLEPGGRIAVNVANLGRRPYRSLSADVIGILQDDLRLLLRGEIVWLKQRGSSGSCAWGSFQRPGNPVLRDLTERVVVASKGRFDRSLSAAGPAPW